MLLFALILRRTLSYYKNFDGTVVKYCRLRKERISGKSFNCDLVLVMFLSANKEGSGYPEQMTGV